MSVLTPEVVDILMNLSCPLEEKTALMKALVRAGQAFQAPASLNGINEERERLRNESTYAERKRAKDRERQRVLREAARQSRDVAGDPSDNRAMSPATLGDADRDTGDEPATLSRTRVRDITPKLVISGLDDDVDCAGAVSSSDDWPDLKRGQTHAQLLAETVASPWLDPKKSPGLIETGGRVVAWRRDGASWEHDVVPVVTALCVKSGKRVGTWRYFDNSIAQAIADNRAALQIPEARVVPFPSTGPPRTIDEKSSASWDYAMAKIAKDDQSQN